MEPANDTNTFRALGGANQMVGLENYYTLDCVRVFDAHGEVTGTEDGDASEPLILGLSIVIPVAIITSTPNDTETGRARYDGWIK